MSVARSVCPGFIVADELKSTINDIFRWCMMLPGVHDPRKGLCLWGDVGTGKTTMLYIIREFCAAVRPYSQESGHTSPAHYWFKIANVKSVCGKFSEKGYPGLNDYINWGRYAFDELGSENLSTYYYGSVENVMQHILQMRYDSRGRNFTHATMNLAPEQLADAYTDRIYDRCREMFNFVEFRGESFRK